jgi:hypothetical protein
MILVKVMVIMGENNSQDLLDFLTDKVGIKPSVKE